MSARYLFRVNTFALYSHNAFLDFHLLYIMYNRAKQRQLKQNQWRQKEMATANSSSTIKSLRVLSSSYNKAPTTDDDFSFDPLGELQNDTG